MEVNFRQGESNYGKETEREVNAHKQHVTRAAGEKQRWPLSDLLNPNKEDKRWENQVKLQTAHR